MVTNNVCQQLMIKCPHCKFGSRYDASIVEDAINDHKMLECVACGSDIKICVASPDPRSSTTRAADQSDTQADYGWDGTTHYEQTMPAVDDDEQ